jgi:Tol biopolymer transport system component
MSPDGSRIVFQSVRDGNQEIYVMNADGSEETRVTDNPAHDAFASWSPDGSKIIFETNRDGNWEIYVMNADGTDQTRITDSPAQDRRPSWSSDGLRITFASDRDGNWEIYTLNVDGTNPIKLTENPADDGYAVCSPDGKRIVFVSDRDGNDGIYVMDADGSNQTKLTHSRAYEGLPSWSPDGLKIAFETDRDFDEEIYVMNADGSNPENLTKNAPINAAIGLAPLPQSELDLEEIPYKIVFESYRETEGKKNWEICLIDADGKGFANLTNTPEINEMYSHASPDGRLLCFVADEGETQESKKRNVYYMNIDGTNKVKIAENAYSPCWSGDGRYIAYLPGEFPRYNRNLRANKGLEFYNIETGEVKQHPNEKLIHTLRICWAPDGRWFVSAGRAFKADDKTMMWISIDGCTSDISLDGNHLVWNGSDWNINIGDLDFDSPRRPPGSYITSWSMHLIDQHSVTNHKVILVCDREHWIYHADWSPDGKYFTFTYGFDDESKPKGKRDPWSHICICDLKTGKWTQITHDGIFNKEPDWVPVQVRLP